MLTSYSPQSIGCVERINRNSIDEIRAVLEEAGMPWRYWREPLGHAATLQNSTLSSAIRNITPQKSLSGNPPNNERFRIVDCAPYGHMDRAVRKAKLADPAQLRVYLGTINSLYRIHLVNANLVVHSKHVVFDEEIFLIIAF